MKTTTKIKKRMLLFVFVTTIAASLMQLYAQPSPLPTELVSFKTVINNGGKITLKISKWNPNDKLWVLSDDASEYILHDTESKEYIVQNNTQDFKIYGKIKSLEIKNSKITSINLSQNNEIKVLILHANQLSSLNVDNLTEKLSYLDFSRNVGLTSVDLSANKKLEILNAYACPKLSTLVLPIEKSKIRKIRLSETKLSDLDLSGYVKLDELQCHRSPELTSLILTGCDELASINTHSCPKLTTADFSELKKLQDLRCGKTKIASLELNSDSLYRLDCDSMGLLADNFKLNKVNNTKVNEQGPVVININCIKNALRGDALDSFIAALPNGKNKKNTTGRFPLASVDDSEGNVVTRVQAKAIADKGWRPLYHDGTTWVALESSSVLVSDLYLSGNSPELGNNDPALAPKMYKNNKSHLWIGSFSNSVPFSVLGKQKNFPVFNPTGSETDITKITDLLYSGVSGNGLSLPSEGMYCVKANFLNDTEHLTIIASALVNNQIKLNGEWNSDDFTALTAAIAGSGLPAPSDIKVDLASSSLADNTSFGTLAQELFKYELSLDANKMATVCLPFAADIIASEGAEYKLKEFTGAAIIDVPSELASTLEANKPYIFSSSTASVYTFVGKAGTMTTANPISKQGPNYTLNATYKPVPYNNTKPYYVADGINFRKLKEDEIVSPYQCYFTTVLLKAPDVLSPDDISSDLIKPTYSKNLEIVSVADGIRINLLKSETVKVYNSLGNLVFVNKLDEGGVFVPLTVGVYIVNGLKVVVK